MTRAPLGWNDHMTSATALMPTAPRVSQHAETPRELVAKTRSWIDCRRGRHDADRLEFLSGLLHGVVVDLVSEQLPHLTHDGGRRDPLVVEELRWLAASG